MPQYVQMPDGTTAPFPDKWSQIEIEAAINERFATPAAEPRIQMESPGAGLPSLEMFGRPTVEERIGAANLPTTQVPGLGQQTVPWLAPLPPRDPFGAPTIGQAGGEMAGSIPGALVGRVIAGSPGAIAGAGLGTLAGGLSSGRGASSVVDAAMAALGELGGGYAAKKTTHFLRPPISQAAQEAAAETRTLTPALKSLILGELESRGISENLPIGKLMQATIAESSKGARASASVMYKPVTEAIDTAVGRLDLADVEKLARSLNISLPEEGVNIARGSVPKLTESGIPWPVRFDMPAPTIPFIQASADDAMKLRSNLLRDARQIEEAGRAAGLNIRGGAVHSVVDLLDEKIATAAETAGVSDAWRMANQNFKTTVSDVFYQDAVEKVVRDSPELMADTLKRSNWEGSTQIFRALDNAPDAKAELSSRIIANMLDQATNKESKVLQPFALSQRYYAIKPEVRRVLFGGPETDMAFKEFVDNYSKAKARTKLAIMGTGMAASTLSIATGTGSLGAGAGAGVETANEWGMIANMLAGGPRGFKAMQRAILTGKDEPLTKVGFPAILRVGTTQLGAQGAMQFIPRPEGLLDLLGREDVPLEQKVNAAMQLGTQGPARPAFGPPTP